jgi:diguanylate cyclase (GGDEF)-like protein/PAS domain S-box-containing protein
MAEFMSPTANRQFCIDRQLLAVATCRHMVSKLLLLSGFINSCGQQIRLQASLLVFALFSFLSAAQSPLLVPLTTEQGLSRGTVNSLYIDRQGFLWVGTSNGLNRYDATRNQVIQSHDHDMTELSFGQVFEDQFGRLWAIANNLGLFRIDKASGQSTLVLELAKLQQPEQPMLSYAIGQDEDHLLLAINKTVYRFHLPTGKLTPIYQIPSSGIAFDRIRQLWLHQQQLLIATNKGLIQFDMVNQTGTKISLGSADEHEIIRHLYPSGQHLYISSGQRLWRLPLTAFTSTTTHPAELLLSELPVVTMLQHQQGFLLGTTQGLYQWIEGQQQPELLWRFSQSNQTMSSELIVDMVASEDGGLWLASRDDGAYYWHPRSTSFRHLELQPQKAMPQDGNSSLNRTVLTMAEDEQHQLWLGGFQGLKKLAAGATTLTDVALPDQLPPEFSNAINRIFPAKDGKLWLRRGSGLLLFSPETNQFLAPPLQDQNQASILTESALGHWQDPEGAFWFYTLSDYYYYQPATGELKTLPAILKAIPIQLAGRFLGFLPDDNDQMLLSAADQLWLYQLSSGRMQKIFQATDYQPSLNRYADKFSLDPQGVLWFTFRGIGLLGFDSKTMSLRYHFDTDNKLLSNQVFANQLDDLGHLWFAGNYGLSRLDTQSLRIEHFSKKDGLASNNFSYGASAKLFNGDLAFATNLGITLFDPAELMEVPAPPEVVITSIHALNEQVSHSLGDVTGQSFTFSHEAMGIEVQFSALNFRDSGKLNYRFNLRGAQALEYPEQSMPSVVFPQLKPGHYTFEVVAVSPMTGMESKPASIELVITSAPWRSPLAIGCYSAAALLLLLLWLRGNSRQKRLLANAHKKLQASEQRLKQALEAVDSGAWEWHANKNSMYALRVHSMLGYNEELNPLTMQQHLSLIHPDDRDNYQQVWQRFLTAPDKGFDHTYRMQHKTQGWLWFRDIGKVTEMSDNQKIERVLGTYSNITETRATKEKARLFGEAFQQTRDWVVLLDLEQRVIAANLSFSDVFGNMDDYLSNPRAHHLGISLSRRRFYTKMLASMTVNQHWQGEEVVKTPDGSERPTLINISAVGDDLQVDFFVLVFTDITAQKQAEEELRYLASYDMLTGLPNRALLMDRIYHGIEKAKREHRSLALCFIDLDKFKQINDSLGHDIGDQLLKKVANRLTNTLRITDSVARLGGDEFVVLLEGYKNNDNISHVARKMIKTIGEPMQLGAHTVSVSPSIGIAIYPEDAHDAKELLKHADVAMYHAKDSGRNNFQFFINEMNEKAYMQLARETQLRSAFSHNEFINYYQPVYDSRTQQMVGAEVLMRWQTEQGLVPPAEFIPLAEDLRLIVPMTQQLLERALADLQHWHQQGYPIYLSVNLSTRHLEQADLAEQTANLLQKYELPASCLKFEVTESALMEDHESAIATMLALSELGIQLALDDFGTGYSSLKYLKELPIDAIKIDRSFVKDIGIDSNDETIIDAMLSMANSLGMYCIAEGVETEQQLAFFSQRQCYLIQGYLFGKPMAAEGLLRRLAEEAVM